MDRFRCWTDAVACAHRTSHNGPETAGPSALASTRAHAKAPHETQTVQTYCRETADEERPVWVGARDHSAQTAARQSDTSAGTRLRRPRVRFLSGHRKSKPIN